MTFSSIKDDLDRLRSIAPSGIVDPGVTTIGQSEQGKNIYAIRIGKNHNMPVLVAGCHHAREWISVEMPYLIAEYLVTNYTSNPQVQRLVDARDIWIVPLINPDGHENSVLNTRLWRKNFPTDPTREKVDLNRNYATAQWSIPTGAFSDTSNDQDYRGPSPGYAKEVTVMQNLITTNTFKGTLDFHSNGRFILFPYAGRTDPPPDAFQAQMAGQMKRIIDTKGVVGTPYRSIQASGLYPLLLSVLPDRGRVPGGMMDYVVENVAGSIAITIELEPAWGDPRAFVLPESEIEPTFNLMRGAMLTFLNCIDTIQHPPATRQLVLQASVANQLVVFQSDCSKAFESF